MFWLKLGAGVVITIILIGIYCCLITSSRCSREEEQYINKNN